MKRLICMMVLVAMSAAAYGSLTDEVNKIIRSDTALTGEKMVTAYKTASDRIAPTLTSKDLVKRTEAMNAFKAMAMYAGRPGAKAERQHVSAMICGMLSRDYPKTVKIFLLEQIQRIGSEESVPFLANMLAKEKDIQLRDSVRQALEANPSPKATQVLRNELAKSKDPRWTAGLIHSLGSRGDQQSVSTIAKYLTSDNTLLVTVATKSLALIADKPGITALTKAYHSQKGAAKKQTADALLDIAHQLRKQGKTADALAIYQAFNNKQTPANIRATALNGLMMTQPKKAADLVSKNIASTDSKIQYAIITAARELDNESVSNALAKKLSSLQPATQILVLGCLAECGHQSVAGQVNKILASGNESVRIAALGTLKEVGNADTIPLLLNIAASKRGTEQAQANNTLNLIKGRGINQAIEKTAAKGDGKLRAVAITAMANRDGKKKIEAFLRYATDQNSYVARAASEALGKWADSKSLPAMIDAMLAMNSSANAKRMLLSIRAVINRSSDKASLANLLITRASSADPSKKVLLFNALADIGGDKSLMLVVESTKSKDKATQDAAIRALANWPDFKATDQLLKIAANDQTALNHHVIALTGAVRLANNPNIKNDKRLAVCRSALSVARRNDEKKMILVTVGRIPNIKSVDIIAPYLTDNTVKNEAGLAALTLASGLTTSDLPAAKQLALKVKSQHISSTVDKKADQFLATLKYIGVSKAGYLKNWLISEPYSGGKMLNKIYAPETNATVQWKPISRQMLTGNVVDFNRHPKLKGRSDTAVYLKTTVNWPKKGKAILKLGSDDAIKVFLNGKVVFTHDASRMLQADNDRVAMNMKKGSNVIMLKIVQYAGGWAAVANLVPYDLKKHGAFKNIKNLQSKPNPAASVKTVDYNRYPFAKPGLHLSKLKSNQRINVMLLTGQMNRAHQWKQTTPAMKNILEASGRFSVDIHTMPQRGSDLTNWSPKFENYSVILMNVDGDYWPDKTQKHFEELVKSGKVNLVIVHSTDNAWSKWGKWNEMIAVGGWGGRKRNAGPYLRWKDGKVVRQDKAGPCGGHGAKLPFVIIHRTPDHPISKGLPKQWLHHRDELYNCLRGPAKNVTVVGSAWSDPKNRGTNEHEPMLMAIRFGKGRIFHTTLGHDIESMRCAGFQVTLQRGTEWASTGKVTLSVPKDFPTGKNISVRKPFKP